MFDENNDCQCEIFEMIDTEISMGYIPYFFTY